MLRVENGRRVYGSGEISGSVLRGLRNEWVRGVQSESIVEVDGDHESGGVYEPPKTTIHLLLTTALQKLLRTSADGFDYVYVSSTMAHRVADVVSLVKKKKLDGEGDGGVLIVESAK